MNYFEGQNRVEQLITLGGWSNAQPPPDLGFLFNYGIGEFVRYTEDNQETVVIMTLPGQATYFLTSETNPIIGYRKWYSWNDDALWNILPGTPGNGSYLPQSTRQKIRQNDIQYLDCPPSIPYVWYKAQDQQIGLYPAPADGGVLIQFSGNRMLPPLVNYTDEIIWHERYGEACALFGAHYYGKAYARGEELQTLSRYHSEALEMVAEFCQDSNNKEAALINRIVQQPPQDYLDAGTRVIPAYRTPDGFFPGQG